MMLNEREEFIPSWAEDARRSPGKPDWIDKIPHELWGLGKVFFPIAPRKKGWNYPHHLDDFRYTADNEILNAYLEAGFNYGIACEGDLIVIDIDKEEAVEEIVSKLPPTVYQWTGSGSGVHLFYICAGVTKRRTLRRIYWMCPECDSEDVDHYGGRDVCDECGWEKPQEHLGELKADPNGYVVGPGSVHPSGNKYGPLKGEELSDITTGRLEDAIGEYIVRTEKAETRDYVEVGRGSDHEFYNLSADDVLPWLAPEERIAHPVHGSKTGNNFMKNSDRETFVCWRCNYGPGGGCVISAQQFLALMAVGDGMGDNCCQEVRRRWRNDSTLHYYAWKEAASEGLVRADRIPYTVIKGFLVDRGTIKEKDHVPDRHQAYEQLKYEILAGRHPDEGE